MNKLIKAGKRVAIVDNLGKQEENEQKENMVEETKSTETKIDAQGNSINNLSSKSKGIERSENQQEKDKKIF